MSAPKTRTLSATPTLTPKPNLQRVAIDLQKLSVPHQVPSRYESQ